MLKVNCIRFSLPQSNVQDKQRQTTPLSKSLEQDTVSFSGWWFSSKPAEPKYVTQEAYNIVKKYIEENKYAKTIALDFMNDMKRICEGETHDALEMDAHGHAREVEKEKIKEISEILMKLKTNLTDTLRKNYLTQLLNDFNSQLGMGSF